MSFLFLCYCLFVCFWRLSVKHHNYLGFLIHEFHWVKILKLLHHEVVWVGVGSLQCSLDSPKAVCGEILMVWFNTATRCKNVETCHFYFKALLVIHLWDIIITSALPSIPSCSCKFWACPCIAGNFDKGRRSWTGHLSPTKVHFVNIFATGWSVTVQCFLEKNMVWIEDMQSL